MSNINKISNYADIKTALDKVTDSAITIKDDGSKYLFEVQGEQYEMDKQYESFLQTYELENQRLKITIETKDQLNNLKNVVEVQQKLDHYLAEFERFADATRRRERRNPFDDKYKGSQYKEVKEQLKIVHKLIENQIIQLKSQKEFTTDHSDLVDPAAYNFVPYENSVKSMKNLLSRSSASEMKGDLDMIINNLKDAKLYKKLQEHAIDYKTEFTTILAELARDKMRIQDFDNLEVYLKKVISGEIPDPASTPYIAQNQADYEYLAKVPYRYPLLAPCIRPPGTTPSTPSTTPDDRDNNPDTNETVDGDTSRERITNAMKQGSLIDAVGQTIKEGAEMAGLNVHLTAQQKGLLRLGAIVGGGILVFKGLKRRFKNRKEKQKNNRRVIAGLAAAELVPPMFGGRGRISGLFGMTLGKGNNRSKTVGEFLQDPSSIGNILNIERKGNCRPATTMLTLGHTTPADGVLKHDGTKFVIDKDAIELKLGMISDQEIKNNMKDNYEALEKEANKDKILQASLAKVGITQADLENPANANKTLLEIAAEKQNTDGVKMKKVNDELAKKGYEVSDSGRYHIYLRYNEKDKIEDLIPKRIKNGWIEQVADSNLEGLTPKERAIVKFEHKKKIKRIPAEFSKYEASIPDDENQATTKLEELLKTATPPCFEYNYMQSESLLLKTRDGVDHGYRTIITTAPGYRPDILPSTEIDAIVGISNMIETKYSRKLSIRFDSTGNIYIGERGSTTIPEMKFDPKAKILANFGEGGKETPFNSIEDITETIAYTMFLMDTFPANSSKDPTPFRKDRTNILGESNKLVYTLNENLLVNLKDKLGADREEMNKNATGFESRRTPVIAMGGGAALAALVPRLGATAAVGTTASRAVIKASYFTNLKRREAYYGNGKYGHEPIIPANLIKANQNTSAYINFLNKTPGRDGTAFFSSAA